MSENELRLGCAAVCVALTLVACKSEPICDPAKLAVLSTPPPPAPGELLHNSAPSHHEQALTALDDACGDRVPLGLRHHIWEGYKGFTPDTPQRLLTAGPPKTVQASIRLEGKRACKMSLAEFERALTLAPPDAFAACGFARLGLLTDAQARTTSSDLGLPLWIMLAWMHDHHVPAEHVRRVWRALSQRVHPDHARARLPHGIPTPALSSKQVAPLLVTLHDTPPGVSVGDDRVVVLGPGRTIDRSQVRAADGVVVPLLDTLTKDVSKALQINALRGKPKTTPVRVSLEVPSDLNAETLLALLRSIKAVEVDGASAPIQSLVMVYDRSYAPTDVDRAWGYTRLELARSDALDVVSVHVRKDSVEVAVQRCVERTLQGGCAPEDRRSSQVVRLAPDTAPRALYKALSDALAAAPGLGVVVYTDPNVPLARLLDAQTIAARVGASGEAGAALPEAPEAFWRALSARKVARDVRFSAAPLAAAPAP